MLTSARISSMLSLIICCGAKTEPIVATNMDSYDFSNNTVVLKNENVDLGMASVYVSRYAVLRETKLAIPKKDDPFFVNDHSERISAGYARRQLYLHIAAAGLKFSILDIRHTYLTNLQGELWSFPEM